MSEKDRPLSWFERLVVSAATMWLPPDRRREVTGDLLEAARARRAAVPHRSHWGWLFREAMAIAGWELVDALGRVARRLRARTPPDALHDIARDLRVAIRSFARTPGFSTVTVMTLALGIGATTAIFTVVNAIAWNSLGFSDSERVVGVCERTGQDPDDFCGISPPNMVDLSRASTTLVGFGLARSTSLLWNDHDGVEAVSAGIGTPGFLTTLGARPLLGRLIEARDLAPDGTRVAVLSHRYWITQFGADSSILGRSLIFDDQPYEVVGVLDAQTDLPLLGWVSLWAPLPWDPSAEENRGWRGFHSIAALRAGVTATEARAELTTLTAHLAAQHPASNAGHRFDIVRLRDHLVRPVRQQLMVFLGASVLVLAIACVNVANLLVARADARRREFAVRASLGARQGRLLQQMLAESLVLCTLGGAAGFSIGHLAVRTFVSLAPPGIPRFDEISMDGAVFGVALVVLAATTVLFGFVPSFFSRRLDLVGAMRQRGRWRAGGQRLGGRSMLVVAEIALAVMLLTGAGLLIRSFATAARWDPGFAVKNLSVMWLLASSTKYDQMGESVRAFEMAAENVLALPDVLAVGMAASGPLFGGYEPGEFTVAGQTDPGPGERPRMRWIDVDANYFATLALPLVAGRVFTSSDDQGTPPVAILNEEAARRLFQDRDPIGQLIIDADRPGTPMEVVGMVRSIRPYDPLGAPEPVVYWPNRQRPRLATYYVVRTSGDPAGVFDAIRDRIHAVDPSMSVGRGSTMESLMGDRLVRPRFQMSLVGIFAAVALLLAAVGAYGVISYTVAGRSHEFGLRMSLGASQTSVLRLVLTQGLWLGTGGLVLGWIGALALTHLMGAMLVGVSPRDPYAFMAVGLSLASIVGLATYVPARRAARIDPTQAMRLEQ